MSLIIATGCNLGDKQKNLLQAKEVLSQKFNFIAESPIYTSAAIEYLNQPDFYNQMLEFELPQANPDQTMLEILELEKELGRQRDIPKGPRLIDIDIIFWGLNSINTENLTTPHPAWQQRSFVVLPMQTLPFFSQIEKHFIIPTEFDNFARPIG